MFIHLKELHKLTNRIAHCGQVLFSRGAYLCSSEQLKKKYTDILSAIRWMSVPAHELVKEHALFEHAADEFIALYYDAKSTRTATAVVQSFNRAMNYGFVTFLSNRQTALLHKSAMDKVMLAEIDVDSILLCDVGPTAQGWRVTRVRECSPPRIIKSRGKIVKYIETKKFAFATINGESRDVLCPAQVLRQADLVAPQHGTELEIHYIESARGLIAKKIKAVR